MSDKIKFGFVSWDWKASIKTKEIAQIQKVIAEATEMEDVETGSDSYMVVIHTPAPGLTARDWGYIEQCRNYDVEFKITPERTWPDVYEATEEELRNFINETVLQGN